MAPATAPLTGHDRHATGFDAYASTPGEPTDGSISAPMVAALEQAWAAIRARHPELPPVVIVIGGGSDKGRLIKFGHYHAMRWTAKPTGPDGDGPGDGPGDGDESGEPLAEVFVGGEGLAREPREVLATLLHEAAHALAFVRGIQDTSRQGRYHNAKFKALAEEVGITVTKDRTIGWSPTTIDDATADSYCTVVGGLRRALRMQRAVDGAASTAPGGNGDDGEGGDGDADGGGPGTRKTPPPCVCGCPRRIRVAPSVLDLGPIVCGICDQAFTPDGEHGDGEHGDRAGRAA